MATKLDASLAFHQNALNLRAYRQQVLAGNIANADTPNYKARDIDFQAALQAAGQGQAVTMAATRPGHIQGAAGPNGRAEALYRVPDQPTLDGNTVDAQKESAAIAETATRYQASLQFLDQRIRGLRMAITGGR